MAESVVGILIKQLSTLLSQEITLLGGLKSDVQFIKDELESMKAFLREAEAKEDNDSQLQAWLKQVREVAYDTEDVLDDFTFRFAREAQLVGIDKPKAELISKILDDHSQLKVVSVAGMGGLGKTTLVKKMEPLSDKESWTLFCNRTFQSNDCGVLALKDKENTDEWEMILHGFGGEADGSGKLDRIKRVLLLSYNDLPHYLKSCLLYISIYPEDYPIDVVDILPKWIALGFVLDLHGAELDNIPKHVFKLFHLKYLSLNGTGVKIIPKSIGKLQNLEVIDLRGTNVTELPVEILKLRKLRSLWLGGWEDETLDLQHSVSPKLGFLTLLRFNGRLERVPQWVTSLQSLRTLRLLNSRLREDENVISSLGHLPNLVSLTLYRAYEGETLCFEVGGFQKLQCLELGQLKRLKWVRVEEESMPSLRIMRLGDCKLMQELPSGIQNLTRLESLGFYEMSNELMHKVRNLDYQTISHIPQVFVGHWIDGQWEGTFL
ncbi:unnamed protein product [Coffea canephora]|uniref:DH200=94 genomic scaffold, scaffold_455 n=1 Tax=Coffea canephora TaxID=49390 RepID=A0A068VF64_COFCA|nr:unnamed protein product [Coffea canephora]